MFKYFYKVITVSLYNLVRLILKYFVFLCCYYTWHFKISIFNYSLLVYRNKNYILYIDLVSHDSIKFIVLIAFYKFLGIFYRRPCCPHMKTVSFLPFQSVCLYFLFFLTALAKHSSAKVNASG